MGRAVEKESAGLYRLTQRRKNRGRLLVMKKHAAPQAILLFVKPASGLCKLSACNIEDITKSFYKVENSKQK
jgi:hypothetical protein